MNEAHGFLFRGLFLSGGVPSQYGVTSRCAGTFAHESAAAGCSARMHGRDAHATLMSPLTHILATSIPLVVYALLGPGSWLVFLAMILMGRARMSRLRRPPLPLPA